MKQTKALGATDIAAAAAILRGGGLVALPTETVYGLGADGFNERAVRDIYAAKGRPADNPLILHIPDTAWLERCCAEVPPLARRLAAAFWPGPLTMVLRRNSAVPDAVTCGLDTVGVRCPANGVTRAVIAAAGTPVAAPSANRSGRPSCTCAADVWEDMDGRIDAVLDGGACRVGVESTIVDVTGDTPRLLRAGGVTLEALTAVCGCAVEVDSCVTRQCGDGERPRAPGMKYRHYAPRAPVTAVTGESARSAAYILRHIAPTGGVICFDECAERFAAYPCQRLGSFTAIEEQARRVFDALRYFDSTEVTEIWAQCPRAAGLGLAVANRIQKAAGFCVIDADTEEGV